MPFVLPMFCLCELTQRWCHLMQQLLGRAVLPQQGKHHAQPCLHRQHVLVCREQEGQARNDEYCLFDKQARPALLAPLVCWVTGTSSSFNSWPSFRFPSCVTSCMWRRPPFSSPPFLGASPCRFPAHPPPPPPPPLPPRSLTCFWVVPAHCLQRHAQRISRLLVLTHHVLQAVQAGSTGRRYVSKTCWHHRRPMPQRQCCLVAAGRRGSAAQGLGLASAACLLTAPTNGACAALPTCLQRSALVQRQRHMLKVAASRHVQARILIV